MDLNTYQELAATTAIYPTSSKITYPLLGLSGEVGEFANKWKKTIRDGVPMDRQDAKAELGDILWYISALARDCRLSLDEIAEANLDKLASRKDRGVLGGSGDNR